MKTQQLLRALAAVALLQANTMAMAATSGTTGSCTWSLSDNTLSISGQGAMADYSSSPTSTTPPWYDNRASIKSVIISSGVTCIGSAAFYGCSGLTGALTIPNSVTSIGSSAFYGCSKLTSVTIPTAGTNIGRSA